MALASQAERWALLLTGLAPLAPTLIGSAVNIWYNLTEIDPLLTETQRRIFVTTITGSRLGTPRVAFGLASSVRWGPFAPARVGSIPRLSGARAA